MGKFKEEFKLIQDTPMWVFNPDDPGCGLRATEVKPKLDRYLREKCDGVTKATNQDWFIGDTDALDYKMRIECSGKEEIPYERQKTKNGKLKWNAIGSDGKKLRCKGVGPENNIRWTINDQPYQLQQNEEKPIPDMEQLYPLFFANMDSKKDTDEAKKLKRLLMFNDITVYIFTKHEALLTKIKETLPKFFACHSFGTRQSKGFGCFSVIKASVIPEGAKYKFRVQNDSFEELFMHIYYFHKLIRSGINENKNYVKSLMFHYAKSKGQNWDKPVIRRKFEYYNDVYKYITNGELPRNENRANYIKNKYVDRSKNLEIKSEHDMSTPQSVILYRDCLGLATEQAWMSYDNRGEKEKITITSDTVKRFMSPIKYHPVKCNDGYIVYIILEEINQDYRLAKFEVLNAVRNNAVFYRDQNAKNTALSASIPSKEQFDLVEYFDFIINNKEKATPITLKKGSQYTFINNAFSTLTKVK